MAEKYVVWVKLNGRAQPILCDDLKDAGGIYTLIAPTISFELDGRSYDAVEWTIGAAKIEAFAKVIVPDDSGPRRIVVGEA